MDLMLFIRSEKANGFTRKAQTLYYVTKPELYSLQYFLQQILNSSSFIKSIYANSGVVSNDVIPVETLKFALSLSTKTAI